MSTDLGVRRLEGSTARHILGERTVEIRATHNPVLRAARFAGTAITSYTKSTLF